MSPRPNRRERKGSWCAYAALLLAGTLSCSEAGVCGPMDTTLSCCVKSHPFDPAHCGATSEEAAAIFTVAAAIAYAETVESPAWKQACIDAYVQCIEQKWTGRCYDCLRYCEGQRKWPLHMCAPRPNR
jgi:hypothetical protein